MSRNTLSRRRFLNYPFANIFFILVTVMFLVIIVLSYNLLFKEECNCKTDENLFYNPINSRSNTKPISTKHRLAVLVPYRDRFEELLEFVPYIHNFLNSQYISHDIFILNQVDSYRFNRASLINVGFIETKEEYDYLVMHDVDLLPLNLNLTYAYSESPFHIASPKLHPRYHYEKFIGGILLMTMRDFELVNGMSNNYWGWGLEDDEFYVRLKDANLTVKRPVNISTGTNNTFRHIHSKERKRDMTKCYNQKEVTKKRDRKTGLHDVKYTIKNYKHVHIEGAPVTIINIKLICHHNVTPWCDCS